MSVKQIHVAMRQEISLLCQALSSNDRAAIVASEQNLLKLNEKLRQVNTN